MSTYSNPVLNTDFPDPSILRASNGWYYAYGTQYIGPDKSINVQTAKSIDLVNWEVLPDALPIKPIWAQSTQDFWAPHVIEAGGLYFLYFSALPDSRSGMAIGVAVSDSPEGPFMDSGRQLVQDFGIGAIDPMSFDDPVSGKTYLYWGSGSQPIKVQELDSTRLNFATGTTPSIVLNPRADLPRERLIEGAFVIYRQGYYFLFYSGDNCWKSRTYAVMVARSTSPLGPFERLSENTKVTGRIILGYSKKWYAPGQNSIISDANGQDWMFYHAVTPASGNWHRPMLMDPIKYIDGWPCISNRKPSHSLQPSPMIK